MPARFERAAASEAPAVPALLSAVSGLASSESGIQKLLSVLSMFTSGSMGNLAPDVKVQPNAVAEQGADILGSLLGGHTLSGVDNAVSRFANIAPASVQKLLSYVTPLLFGTIASQFGGKPVSTQGLSNLFAEQKANIARALPSGLQLWDIPGGLAAAVAAGKRPVSRPRVEVPGCRFYRPRDGCCRCSGSRRWGSSCGGSHIKHPSRRRG